MDQHTEKRVIQEYVPGRSRWFISSRIGTNSGLAINLMKGLWHGLLAWRWSESSRWEQTLAMFPVTLLANDMGGFLLAQEWVQLRKPACSPD